MYSTDVNGWYSFKKAFLFPRKLFGENMHVCSYMNVIKAMFKTAS